MVDNGLQPATVYTRLIFTVADPAAALERLVAIDFTAFAIEDQTLTAWPGNAAEAEAISTALGLAPVQCHELTHAAVYAEVTPTGTWLVADGCWVLSGTTALPAGAAAPRAVVYLPAGGGFGDGQHPATGLACSLLASMEMTGARVLDVGCGTGLLGVLAWRLGAAHVDFSDVDGDSVLHTRACCAANGLAAEVFQADLLTGIPTPARPYDLLIANLYGEFLTTLFSSPRLTDLLPTGEVVLSGISAGKLSMVESALASAGFTITRRMTDAGWWGLGVCRE